MRTPGLAFFAAVVLVGANLFAAVLWLTAVGGTTVVARSQPLGLRNLARSWSLAAYFGLQSMVFYCGLTWLPSILEQRACATSGRLWSCSSPSSRSGSPGCSRRPTRPSPGSS